MKKRNLGFLISAVALLVVGVVLAIVLNVVKGMDLAAMFASKWAITIEIAIAVYVLVVAIILITDKVKKL